MNAYGFASGDRVNFSDPMGLCKNPLGGGLAGLQCAVEDIGTAIKRAPSELASMAKVAVTNPIASQAVFGIIGEGASAARVGRIVIGETAERVAAYAIEHGAEHFVPKTQGFVNMMRENMTWLRDKIGQGYEVIDIGLDPTRAKRGVFYEAESKVIQRTGVATKKAGVP